MKSALQHSMKAQLGAQSGLSDADKIVLIPNGLYGDYNAGSLGGNFSGQIINPFSPYAANKQFVASILKTVANTGSTISLPVGSIIRLFVTGLYKNAAGTNFVFGDKTLTRGNSYIEITNTTITVNLDGAIATAAHALTWVADDNMFLGVQVDQFTINKMHLSAGVPTSAFLTSISPTRSPTENIQFSDELYIGATGNPALVSGLYIGWAATSGELMDFTLAYENWNQRGQKIVAAR